MKRGETSTPIPGGILVLLCLSVHCFGGILIYLVAASSLGSEENKLHAIVSAEVLRSTFGMQRDAILPGEVATRGSRHHPIVAWEDMLSHSFVVQDPKFVLCTVPKAGSSTIRRVPFYFWDIKYASQKPLSDMGVDSTLGHFEPLEANATAIMNDPKYFKAMVVREPLERWLSAYEDKCMRNCWLKECVLHDPQWDKDCTQWWEGLKTGANRGHTKPSIPVEDAVMGTLSMGISGNKRWSENRPMDVHFLPQYHFCGAHKFGYSGNNFHVWHFNSDRERFLHTVEQILLGAGADPEIALCGKVQSDPEHCINLRRGQYHATNSNAEKVQEVLTKRQARKLIDFYRVDYELFGFSIPKWPYESLAAGGDEKILLQKLVQAQQYEMDRLRAIVEKHDRKSEHT